MICIKVVLFAVFFLAVPLQAWKNYQHEYTYCKTGKAPWVLKKVDNFNDAELKRALEEVDTYYENLASSDKEEVLIAKNGLKRIYDLRVRSSYDEEIFITSNLRYCSPSKKYSAITCTDVTCVFEHFDMKKTESAAEIREEEGKANILMKWEDITEEEWLYLTNFESYEKNNEEFEQNVEELPENGPEELPEDESAIKPEQTTEHSRPGLEPVYLGICMSAGFILVTVLSIFNGGDDFEQAFPDRVVESNEAAAIHELNELQDSESAVEEPDQDSQVDYASEDDTQEETECEDESGPESETSDSDAFELIDHEEF